MTELHFVAAGLFVATLNGKDVWTLDAEGKPTRKIKDDSEFRASHFACSQPHPWRKHDFAASHFVQGLTFWTNGSLECLPLASPAFLCKFEDDGFVTADVRNDGPQSLLFASEHLTGHRYLSGVPLSDSLFLLSTLDAAGTNALTWLDVTQRSDTVSRELFGAKCTHLAWVDAHRVFAAGPGCCWLIDTKTFEISGRFELPGHETEIVVGCAAASATLAAMTCVCIACRGRLHVWACGTQQYLKHGVADAEYIFQQLLVADATIMGLTIASQICVFSVYP